MEVQKRNQDSSALDSLTKQEIAFGRVIEKINWRQQFPLSVGDVLGWTRHIIKHRSNATVNLVEQIIDDFINGTKIWDKNEGITNIIREIDKRSLSNKPVKKWADYFGGSTSEIAADYRFQIRFDERFIEFINHGITLLDDEVAQVEQAQTIDQAIELSYGFFYSRFSKGKTNGPV